MLIKENIINALKQQNKQGFMLCEIISIINEVTQTIELPNIESEGITLNHTNFEVVIGDKSIKIPKKEFQLLYYLISRKNKVLYRNDIIRDVWGTEVVVIDRTIDVHIRKLRGLLGKDNLRTFKCVGYGWFETK
jgi:two-component system alkaline phosphatase synthesis response regulator PhoP